MPDYRSNSRITEQVILADILENRIDSKLAATQEEAKSGFRKSYPDFDPLDLLRNTTSS